MDLARQIEAAKERLDDVARALELGEKDEVENTVENKLR